MNKTKYLDAAQLFDTFRIVPRLVLFSYGAWVAHVIDRILNWYMTLPSTERTVEASGLAGVIITVVTGLFPWIYKIYSDASTDWSGQPQTSKVQTVAVTSEVTK